PERPRLRLGPDDLAGPGPEQHDVGPVGDADRAHPQAQVADEPRDAPREAQQPRVRLGRVARLVLLLADQAERLGDVERALARLVRPGAGDVGVVGRHGEPLDGLENYFALQTCLYGGTGARHRTTPCPDVGPTRACSTPRI